MPRHSYQLTARVEAGDISDLYLGLQDRNREVTLKVFSARASDADYGRALVDAARAVGNLQHPAILHVEDVGTYGSRLFAVRAHVDGHHLGIALTRLATRAVVLPGPVALQIMTEVMAALGAAHAAGLTHGALTPANILVARDGRVFVTDFGALAAMQQSPLLRPLASRGRRVYRAPELEKGSEPSALSDVFSVGAILYELLTLRAVGNGQPGVSPRSSPLVPPSRLDGRVDAGLDSLVLRALAPSGSQRFSSGREMEEQFRSYLGAPGGGAGQAEIARFVCGLLPNELMANGQREELPFKGEFELEQLHTGASIPGLAIEVGERVSYSAPAPSETDPELPEARAPDATTLDPEPPLFVPGTISPPGEPEKTEPKGPPSVEVESGLAPLAVRRPIAAPTGVSRPDDPIALGGMAGRARAASIVIPWARARSKSTGMWLLATAMTLGAAVLTYLGVERRIARHVVPVRHSWDELAAPGRGPEAASAAAAAAHLAEGHHDMAARAAVALSCLTLRADVHAEVRIDDGPPMALPLDTYAVTPGPHKLLVEDPQGRYAARRVDITDDDTRCPGRPVKVALRHRDARD